jgi:rare lipoprotein A (peptidoglycan hydrolase)
VKTFKQFQEQAQPSSIFNWTKKPESTDKNVETSSYGPGLYGNKTADGTVLTPNTRGVAHKTLPLGTQVRITDPRTGRSVTAPVIDRGPYHGNREYDLTTGTTQQLGYPNYKEFGARTLKVGPLPKPKPSPIFKYPEKPKSIFNWKK